jgi:hypothetical protein
VGRFDRQPRIRRLIRLQRLRQGALMAPLFLWLLIAPLRGATAFDPILANAGVMPPKEVSKIREMGKELYEKTRIPVYVAIVEDLNKTRPVDLIGPIAQRDRDYILIYFSLHPKAVNIFASDRAKTMIDIDQILSPLPWRGTIRPVMSPGMGKDEKIKHEAAVLNGYADVVDQVASHEGVELKSSIGSGNKTTFKYFRWLIYGIFAAVLFQFIFYKRKRDG